jgi:hypothetical protein
MNTEENIQATPFNFAMIYYMNLNNLIIIKDNAYMSNDIYGYYKGLDRIYNMMYFKIAEKETKDGDEGESKSDIKELNSWFKDSETKLKDRQPKKDILPILHQIDKRLMVLMNKYKMIFPNIESVHGLEKLDAKYKLGNNKVK